MRNDTPLTIESYPRAIIHIDGDAFFASCEQARDPTLQGKPVVTGKERGIAASMSYEAKARGVTRGMRLFEIRTRCPDAIVLPSDYETYSLLSTRFFEIVRRYTPDVEEYGIDECFADLTGLRRLFRMGYAEILADIKKTLDGELGFTFSAGLGPNKVIAKLASKWQKPSGLTAIPGYDIHRYLATLPLEKLWGVGPQTTAYLHKHGITTALEFARKSEAWVTAHLTKPHVDIWRELTGHFALPLALTEKNTAQSIQKVKTFTPPSDDHAFLFSQLSKNIENACIKLRRYGLAAKRAAVFIRTQTYRHSCLEVRFTFATSVPSDILRVVAENFDKLFTPGQPCRATGVALSDLVEHKTRQPDLFGETDNIERLTHLFDVVDNINRTYGKHTVYLASSQQANAFAQHEGERGDVPVRKTELFRGETKRKRLNIPMLMGGIT